MMEGVTSLLEQARVVDDFGARAGCGYISLLGCPLPGCEVGRNGFSTSARLQDWRPRLLTMGGL